MVPNVFQIISNSKVETPRRDFGLQRVVRPPAPPVIPPNISPAASLGGDAYLDAWICYFFNFSQS